MLAPVDLWSLELQHVQGKTCAASLFLGWIFGLIVFFILAMSFQVISLVQVARFSVSLLLQTCLLLSPASALVRLTELSSASSAISLSATPA